MSIVDVSFSPETVAELRRIGIKPGVAYMPVPRCDGCRWWRPFAAELQPGALGALIEAKAGRDVGLSTLSRLGDCTLFECRNGSQEHTQSMVNVTRTGSGEATIVTRADFGCVQHEACP